MLIFFLSLQRQGKLKSADKTGSDNFKSSTGSTRNQKRKSIGGLSKVNLPIAFVVNVVMVFISVFPLSLL